MLRVYSAIKTTHTSIERRKINQNPDIAALGLSGHHHHRLPQARRRIAHGDIDQNVHHANCSHQRYQCPHYHPLEEGRVQDSVEECADGELGNTKGDDSKNERNHVPQEILLDGLGRELVCMLSISVCDGDGCCCDECQAEYLPRWQVSMIPDSSWTE